MAVQYQLSTSLQNQMADLIGSNIDAGAGAGTIKVYVGTLPSNLNPGSDTLLGTWTLADPSTGSAAGGVETLNAVSSATVAASGTPGYFIIFDSNGVAVLGGNVATASAALVTSTSPWVAGATISLTAGTFSVQGN